MPSADLQIDRLAQQRAVVNDGLIAIRSSLATLANAPEDLTSAEYRLEQARARASRFTVSRPKRVKLPKRAQRYPAQIRNWQRCLKPILEPKRTMRPQSGGRLRQRVKPSLRNANNKRLQYRSALNRMRTQSPCCGRSTTDSDG